MMPPVTSWNRFYLRVYGVTLRVRTDKRVRTLLASTRHGPLHSYERGISLKLER